MDPQNTTPNDQNDLQKQYQEILEKYTKDLSATSSQQIPDPTNVEATEKSDELIMPPPTNLSVSSPDVRVKDSSNSIIPPPVIKEDLLLVKPFSKSGSNPVKIFFLISILLFLGVSALLAYTFLSPNKNLLVSQDSSDVVPSIAPTLDGKCNLNGLEYESGQSFPSADGCNTCSCQSDQTIVCTEKACGDPTSPDYWQTFTSKTIKMSFKYPKSLTIREKIDPGDTGSMYLLQVGLDGQAVNLAAGLTKDYSQGRGGGFLDFSGFREKNGQYYYSNSKLPEDLWLIDSKFIKRIYTNQDNIKIILLAGQDEPDNMILSPYNPGINSTGAYVNTSNNVYPGLAFETNKHINEDILLQILDSLKFD